MPHLTSTTINILLWAISLILQSTLFLSLFVRRIAGRAPFFTIFIGFYLLRSTLLFLIYGHIGDTAYTFLYNLLLVVDIIVQSCISIEILSTLIREQGGWTLERSIAPAILFGAAAIATFLAVQALPHTPIPIDRSQLFFSLLQILLCVRAMTLSTSSPLVCRITLGLAFYATINLIATAGRTIAAVHKQPGQYANWSYALAAAYLLAVLFWLLTPDKTLSSSQS
ncbi:MAG TPA: hypothetical protein VIX42_01240 [Edaphobacter sp.]